MPQNFIESSREQTFLLPPSLRDWLPEDHLAWFVIQTVDEVDLSAFFSAYRADGLGRAAYDPAVMVALVLYAFSIGERSARAIEAHCRQDVAFGVICGNLTPDHATIARFLRRHEHALCGLFGSVLGLCERAGLVGPVWSRWTARRCRATQTATATWTMTRSAGDHRRRDQGRRGRG